MKGLLKHVTAKHLIPGDLFGVLLGYVNGTPDYSTFLVISAVPSTPGVRTQVLMTLLNDRGRLVTGASWAADNPLEWIIR